MAEKAFITRIDPELPAKQRAKLLQQMIENAWEGLGDDEEFQFTPKDVELLRQYTRDKSYLVRSVAVRLLAEDGPCDWPDIEEWLLDRSQHVRNEAVWSISFRGSAANELCKRDKERCVSLLEMAAEQHVDYGAATALHDLSNPTSPEMYIPEWVEVTWRATDRLLNLQREDITLMLVCCYFEHVIPDNNWGPEDPHIRPWIEGTDVQRKLVLLAIALWWRFDEGKLREITEVLSQDSDKSVAWMAKTILRGHVPHIEVEMRHYEIVRKWLEKRRDISLDCGAP